MKSSRREALRRAMAALCVVGVLLPAAAGAAAAPESAPADDLERVESELEDAREGLDVLAGQRVVTVEDLDAADARRRELAAQLDALNGDLAAAQSGLGAAEAALATTTQELVTTQDELAATRAQLAHDRRRFSAKVRSSYMYGSNDYLSAVLSVRDAAELGHSMRYVQAVVEADRAQVERVVALEREVAAATDELTVLQQRHADERAAEEVERDQVAALVNEQQAVTDEAAVETERHRLVLVQIEQDQGAHEALVADLEADSQQLGAELASRAEQQRIEAARVEQERLAQERLAQEAAAAALAEAPPEPASEAPAVATAPAEPAAPTPPPPASTGTLSWPAQGRLSSGYGYRTHPISGVRRLHAGIDIANATGTPIYAAADGVVVSAGWRGGYGNATVIDHGGGMATLSAHQSRMTVSAGQRVSRGQVIGAIGSTGYSTGPHLHFEVRINGQPRDPMQYL